MEIPAKHCLSTHGGAGYAPGAYWDGEVIVCGFCGARVENPPPTGYRLKRASFLGRLLYQEKDIYVSLYPDWIRGSRGKPWKGGDDHSF